MDHRTGQQDGIELRRDTIVRRILVMAIMAVTLAASGGTAHAQAERACVGTFVSTSAQAGIVGETAPVLAKAFQPFGQEVSGFATTCENPLD